MADRLDQVRLAQAHAAVDEQRVVRRRVLGDLEAGGARELVRLAGHERLERERAVEARRLDAARRWPTAARAGSAGAARRGAGAPLTRRQPAPASGRRRRRHRRRRSPTAALRRARTRSPAARRPASRASAAMRLPKRSLTHWSTKRLGARSLRLPSPGSTASGRIQVANCCGVSSRSKADRHAVHAAGVVKEADIGTGLSCRVLRPFSCGRGGLALQKRTGAPPEAHRKPGRGARGYAHSKRREPQLSTARSAPERRRERPRGSPRSARRESDCSRRAVARTRRRAPSLTERPRNAF